MDLSAFNLEHGGKKVKLMIWDTAGQERFRTLAPIYYRNADAAIVVCDITDPSSFEYARDRSLASLEEYAGPETKKILVGNKCDLKCREIPFEGKSEAVRLEIFRIIDDVLVGSSFSTSSCSRGVSIRVSETKQRPVRCCT